VLGSIRLCRDPDPEADEPPHSDEAACPEFSVFYPGGCGGSLVRTCTRPGSQPAEQQGHHQHQAEEVVTGHRGGLQVIPHNPVWTECYRGAEPPHGADTTSSLLPREVRPP
jgi:hypothetical protein